MKSDKLNKLLGAAGLSIAAAPAVDATIVASATAPPAPTGTPASRNPADEIVSGWDVDNDGSDDFQLRLALTSGGYRQILRPINNASIVARRVDPGGNVYGGLVNFALGETVGPNRGLYFNDYDASSLSDLAPAAIFFQITVAELALICIFAE